MSETASNRGTIPGDWAPTIRDALTELIADAPLRTEGTPPLAVLDWDNTCIYNDIGEASFFDLIERLEYRFELDAFWETIPLELGREELRELWRSIPSAPLPSLREDSAYGDFRARFGHLYDSVLETKGTREAYAWAPRLLVGYTPEAMIARTDALIDRQLATPIGRTEWTSSDGVRIRLHEGIRLFAPIVALIRELEASGFEVWVVSASPRVQVIPFARRVGVPSDRILAMTNAVRDGTLTSEVLPPITFREGKVEAIERGAGRMPLLAIGDTYTDFEMLDAAHREGGVAILLDRGDETVRRHAERSGWFVQPRWSEA